MPAKFAPKPRCPLRPDDYCSLCVPGANGPQDCGLVYLVMSDPEAREIYAKKRRERQARLRAEKAARKQDKAG
ncbi:MULTISPECIES: DUF6767 domain-containing protein [Propionimicrobium]|uniref:DUF6767 domain-containing protein n=1 Tax=Propionimicrobium TaxID=203133 RepID=UPI0003A6829F|nr:MULTISPECIES: DUF6767 domain-containing protein [Propionimicrobium]ETJ98188.1 hypothetical protein HMPREF1255_1682 [Propionimicrobium sp. BV2F7]